MDIPFPDTLRGITVPIIPIHKLRLELPFYTSISAGFPSPADDFVEKTLDLNEFLIASPSTTFFVRVSGFSMQGAGIYENDILIVDRSIEVKNKDVIVAYLDGEFTVKRYLKKSGKHYLKPEHPDYPLIELDANETFQVWGVVTNVIHKPYEL
jgi:DNA polymerase V